MILLINGETIATGNQKGKRAYVSLAEVRRAVQRHRPLVHISVNVTLDVCSTQKKHAKKIVFARDKENLVEPLDFFFFFGSTTVVGQGLPVPLIGLVAVVSIGTSIFIIVLKLLNQKRVSLPIGFLCCII